MNSPSLRLAFAGTPTFAVSSLQALIDSQHDVLAVYTQPDRAAGRGRKLTPSPVKVCAIEANIPVMQPPHFRQDSLLAELQAMKLDALIVVAYGHLIPPSVLACPRLGCLNVHASLLPRWRGAAPINAAILAGDTQTGITIMQMEAGLDTGPMLMQATIPVRAMDTAATLHDQLAELGSQLLMQTLAEYAAGNLNAQAQDDTLANYAPKISKQDANIHWQQPAVVIERQIRAYNPWPVCFTSLQDKSLRIWQADVVTLPTTANSNAPPGTIVQADKEGIVIATGQDCLRILRCQLPGKAVHSCAEVMNAYANLFPLNQRLGS